MTSPPTRRPLYASLYFQVIVAVIAGVLLGVFAPSAGEATAAIALIARHRHCQRWALVDPG